MIFTAPRFLVGCSDSEINHVGELYPDDPTQVGHLTQFWLFITLMSLLGIPFRCGDE